MGMRRRSQTYLDILKSLAGLLEASVSRSVLPL